MTPALVLPVEPAGVRTVQPVHAAREVCLGSLNDEMKVVRHQHPHRDAPAESPGRLAEKVHECDPIVVTEKDWTPFIAARGDVVHSAREFNAKWSCHSSPRFPRLFENAEESPRRRANGPPNSSEWKIRLHPEDRP